MTVSNLMRSAVAGAALFLAGAVHAGDTIKIGVIAEMSGQFGDIGKKIQDGIELYMKKNGDTVAGKKVQIILKDNTGPAPEVSKRLAQELVTRDNVDFIAGFGLTPNALAVAPVATEAKKPTVIMNAATSVITSKSPYIVRFSMTLPQVTAPLGEWAAKNKIRKVFIIVSDYGPGHDSEAAFTKSFTAGGGEIVGSVRVPMKNMEFSPFLKRAKDAQPEAVFCFVPSGDAGIAFMKAYAELGMAKAGIKLITTGDAVEDAILDSIGDVALGTISTHHYSMAHDSPENKAFIKAYTDMFGPKARPDFVNVAAYDAMDAIYEVARKLNGNIDGDKAMALFKGMKRMSARGPFYIDPDTRDPVQTMYVRRTEKVNGRLMNVEFDKIEGVRDPGTK